MADIEVPDDGGIMYEQREALEVAMAHMETRLRNMIAELLAPSIQRTSAILTDVDGLKSISTQHTRGLQEVQLGQFKAMEQVATIASFKEEMGRWDAQRRAHETSLDEKLEEMKQRMEFFNYSLEQKESALHHLNRNVDRVAAELNHIVEEQEVQKDNFEGRIDDQSRRINDVRSQFDVRMAGLELRHNALSDELWGEETGLAKAIGELKKTNTAFGKLEASVAELKKGKAEAAQLDKLRSEVQKLLVDANASVAHMQQSVGNVVNDVKEHFRTASHTIAAHNATFIGEVRTQYQAELATAAHLRDEVKEFMGQTEKSIGSLDARVTEASDRASALAAEARGEVEELNRRRKRDKTSADNELKALKQRLSGVFESSDMVLRGIEHIYSVMQLMLESDRMQCSVELQDTADRRRIALMGMKDDDTALHRTTHSEPQRPRAECRSRSANPSGARAPGVLKGGPGTMSARSPQEPVVRVDQRCLSCSGQAPLVLSAFKMACLQYAPSPVDHDGGQHDRAELLEQRHGLLQNAHMALVEGPQTSAAGGTTAKRSVEPERDSADERASDTSPRGSPVVGMDNTQPLAEYALAEARFKQTRPGGGVVRLPNLSATATQPPVPRTVAAR